MIGANKILTVSYGTFSCTLEGFDEPFTTMKAIAEYFRDLAAEDRYFGAEPPTPDAEMLHRIAEREIQRRVEAKISENTVVLRQMETSAPVTPPVAAEAQAPASAPAPVVLSEVAATTTPVVADAVAAAPVEDDSISDKLRRIRAVVTNAQTQPAVAAVAVAESAFYEDLADTDADLASDAPEYAEPMDDDFGFTLELDPQDLSDVLALNEPDAAAEDTVTAAEALAPQVAVQEQGAQDAGDVRWDDLEAEVARADISADATPAYDELTAEWEAAEEEASLDALRDALVGDEAIAEDAADTPLAQEDTPQDIAAEDFDEVEDVLTIADDATEAAVWEAIEEAGPAHTHLYGVTETAPRSEAEIWDDVEHATQVAQADDLGDAAVASDVGMDELEDEDDDTPMSPLASLIARTRVRVEGVRNGTHADDRADDDMDDLRADAEEDAIVTTEDATALIAGAAEAEPEDDAEDDLIAGIEAAIGAIDEREAVAAAEAQAEEAGRPAAAGKAMLADDAEEGDDFERLMEEANTKLEGAESRRRFSAISHLKAAVAATVADRILKPKDAPAESLSPSEPEINRYRDDLSRAVRPRRPEAEGERVTARPAMAMRPAPLVLVSEQRVDRENLQPAAAVRPRRVATTLIVGDEDDMNDAEPLSPEDAKSFTEFAERLGARSLAELLEVAAVYTATVEGKNSFSRPHLLRRVNAATGVEDFSREDYLRSFGSLLRQGRIQKVEPGRFSVTDVSPFMTEMRRAAN